MLILSRHRNEDVLIGDDIVVRVVEIRGDQVRLGITAPDSVHIDRAELRGRILREGRRLADDARVCRGMIAEGPCHETP